MPSNISQETDVPRNHSEIQPPASPAGKHQCSSSWLRTLSRNLRGKKSGWYLDAGVGVRKGECKCCRHANIEGKAFFYFPFFRRQIIHTVFAQLLPYFLCWLYLLYDFRRVK